MDTRIGVDASKDGQGVCTPGLDLTCSHVTTSSAIAGTCQANGTCLCKPGYVIVPSSEVKTTRMDIDGISVKGLFGCR